MAIWHEHFQKLLDVPGYIVYDVLDSIPQRITNTNIDEIPTMAEMAKKFTGLRDATRIGEMEFLLKYDNLFSRLRQLIPNAWEVGSVPKAWKDPSIVSIYKKGDRTVCGNYRGISLLYIAGKIFAKILLNRLSTHITPTVVPETQSGFRGNRVTVDMTFDSDSYKKSALDRTNH